jgi:DNA-directed RNA polymerase subunit E'/Rpb7
MVSVDSLTAIDVLAVTFKYVVFRPFIDEILVGKIKSSGSEGIFGK